MICRVARSQELPPSAGRFSATAAADAPAAVGGRGSVVPWRRQGRSGRVDRSHAANLDKMGSGRSSCARKKNTDENVSV